MYVMEYHQPSDLDQLVYHSDEVQQYPQHSPN